MTDVLLAYNDLSAHSSYSTGLGLASIAASLHRAGYSVGLVYLRSERDCARLVRRVESDAPLVVGYYGPSSAHKSTCDLSAAVREADRRAFQVYGGPHASICPEVLDRMPHLDAVCVGYGEGPMCELAARLASGADVVDVPGLWVRAPLTSGQETIRNSPWLAWVDSVDELFEMDYQLFLGELERFSDFDREQFNLDAMVVRGCPYSCAFCSNRALRRVNGRLFFRPSPDRALSVLSTALTDTGLRRVELHDEILTLDHAWFAEFIAGYRDRVRAPFWCNLRAGTFVEDDVRMLKAAGAERVFLGLESGNDYIRNGVMKKGIGSDVIMSACEMLHEYDVPFVTQNIIGVPHETPAAFLDTVRLNAIVRPSATIISIFYPYPGTELEGVCRDLGVLSVGGLDTAVERMNTTLNLPAFPRRKVALYRRYFDVLIAYERARGKRRWLLPIPLRPSTVRLIGVAHDLWRRAKSLLARIGASGRGV